HDAPAAHRRRQEVARPGELGVGADRQPLGRENRAFFGLEGVALGVVLGSHALCIQYLLQRRLFWLILPELYTLCTRAPWQRVHSVWLWKRRSSSAIRRCIHGARPGPPASSTVACSANGSSSTITMSATLRSGSQRSTPTARTPTCSTFCSRTSPRRKASSACMAQHRCAIPTCCWSSARSAA